MIVSCSEVYVSKHPTAVALGTFDGMHLGHRAVIDAAVDAARTYGLLPAVFTFDSLPRNAFLPADRRVPMICGVDERLGLMQSLGVGLVICPHFAAELSGLDARVFIETVLVKNMNAHIVVCGDDHRFGAGGRGDTALLESVCGELGVRVIVVPPVAYGGEKISSTRVRAALAAGDIRLASALLGRPHSVQAPVLSVSDTAPFCVRHGAACGIAGLLPQCGEYRAVIGASRMTATTVIDASGVVSYTEGRLPAAGRTIIEFLDRC